MDLPAWRVCEELQLVIVQLYSFAEGLRRVWKLVQCSLVASGRIVVERAEFGLWIFCVRERMSSDHESLPDTQPPGDDVEEDFADTQPPADVEEVVPELPRLVVRNLDSGFSVDLDPGSLITIGRPVSPPSCTGISMGI